MEKIKDFFLYLGVLITLYFTAGSLISLLFTVTDVYTGLDKLYVYQTPSISFPVASLIILFPAFLILSYLAYKKTNKDFWMRRLFIYLTLFVSGAMIAGDLVALLYRFLEGLDIVNSFLLKVIIIFVVSSTIFVYYFLDIKDRLNKKIKIWFITSVSILILLSIISGFAVIGTPKDQRMKRFDKEKVNDLKQLQGHILKYWQQKDELPENLFDLKDPVTDVVIAKDPQTDQDYGYEKINETEFKLCAEFNKEGTEGRLISGPVEIDHNWKHPKGYFCFDRTIDPILHKNNE